MKNPFKRRRNRPSTPEEAREALLERYGASGVTPEEGQPLTHALAAHDVGTDDDVLFRAHQTMWLMRLQGVDPAYDE